MVTCRMKNSRPLRFSVRCAKVCGLHSQPFAQMSSMLSWPAAGASSRASGRPSATLLASSLLTCETRMTLCAILVQPWQPKSRLYAEELFNKLRIVRFGFSVIWRLLPRTYRLIHENFRATQFQQQYAIIIQREIGEFSDVHVRCIICFVRRAYSFISSTPVTGRPAQSHRPTRSRGGQTTRPWLLDQFHNMGTSHGP